VTPASPRPVLITGALGFVGRHLAAALAADGTRVVGLDREVGTAPPAGWSCEAIDLLDGAAVARLVADLQPAAIYHLAAASSAGASFADPRATLEGNLLGAVNLLEAVRARPDGGRPRLLLVGSGEEYGAAARPDRLCREDNPLEPVSPYGVSKAAQTLLGRQYHRSWGLPVVMTRSFNHTGPGQDTRFVFPSFAAQIAAAEAGRREPVLEVGDLAAARDLLDVRDVVAAYRQLAARGRAGEVYNVCSGRALTIREGLQILLQHASVDVEIRQDPARMRPAEIPCLAGDPGKLNRDTGWQPAIPFRQTLAELLERTRKDQT